VGKSTNGPDWTDCATLIRELELEWDVSISALMGSDGSAGGGGFTVHVLTMPRRLVDPWEPGGMGITFRYPDGKYQTFWGALHAALWRVDDTLTGRVLAEAEKQLPF